MATVGLPVHSTSVDATTDVGAIWNEAINRYEDITKVKIESMTPASNVDAVMSEIRKRETTFQGYRHDGTKLDRFRTLVSKSLRPIEQVGSIVASAASAVRRKLCLLVD
jgi:ankyrin repeat domain-containing protein 50